VAVLDDDELPEALAGGREDDSPSCRSADGRALGRRNVDARMEAVASRTEHVAEWTCDRLNELDRRTRQWPAKRCVSRRARSPVRLQPGPDLELSQRRVGVRTEHAVDDRRREAVPRERELKRRYVPAAAADREVPAPERRAPTVAAEGLARPRSDDAVRGEARTALEPHECPLRARPEDAVDRSCVQAVRPEADLKRGNVRIPCTGSATRKGGREDPEHCESRR
jgi:hypothetical protein